jgi:hypothetical protein
MKVTISASQQPGGRTALTCSVETDVQDLSDQSTAVLIESARRCEQLVQAATSQTTETHQYSAPPKSNSTRGGTRRATEKQVRAITIMSDRQGIELRPILQSQFAVLTVGELSIRQASALIDQLKENLQTA